MQPPTPLFRVEPVEKSPAGGEATLIGKSTHPVGCTCAQEIE